MWFICVFSWNEIEYADQTIKPTHDTLTHTLCPPIFSSSPSIRRIWSWTTCVIKFTPIFRGDLFLVHWDRGGSGTATTNKDRDFRWLCARNYTINKFGGINRMPHRKPGTSMPWTPTITKIKEERIFKKKRRKNSDGKRDPKNMQNMSGRKKSWMEVKWKNVKRKNTHSQHTADGRKCLWA